MSSVSNAYPCPKRDILWGTRANVVPGSHYTTLQQSTKAHPRHQPWGWETMSSSFPGPGWAL